MKKTIHQSRSNSLVYSIAQNIRRCIGEIRTRISENAGPEKMIITLSPEGEPRGSVLFSYIINGFLLNSDEPMPNKHTNFWQTVKMAETFVELGYEVDVIHFSNSSFIPRKQYAFIVDVRHNLERLAPELNRDCIKIMHLDTANILFHNAAETKRLLQLQERRGITLKPRRFETPNLGIEHADYATTCGNDFTVDTFRYAKKKIYKLPSPCAIMLDWQEKEWERCRTRFLWFSSGGLVHKGLDLALEAFSEMPEFHLTVCAPLKREKDFVNAYHRELYETPNIKTVGWVDIESDQFREIAASCGAMVNLSCSEGGTPAVKTCMHAGLIPVTSCASGVDVHDFGFTLSDCSISGVRDMIRDIASLSSDEIKARARKAWEFARSYHTRENFAKVYKKIIQEIIDDTQSKSRLN